jgi:hypothetical protein
MGRIFEHNHAIVYIKSNLPSQTKVGYDNGTYLMVHPAGTFTVIAEASGYTPVSYSEVVISESGTTTRDLSWCLWRMEMIWAEAVKTVKTKAVKMPVKTAVVKMTGKARVVKAEVKLTVAVRLPPQVVEVTVMAVALLPRQPMITHGAIPRAFYACQYSR